MHQKKDGTKFVGGGKITNDEYFTWSVQVCPICGKEVEEAYSAVVKKHGKRSRSNS
jgi:hypothetical protein